MAFDGIVIANLVNDLNNTISDCRISKIAQPEKDELLFTIKGSCGQVRLLISASASLPLMYLTKENKPSPLTAPNFCMLLRKHISNGRITAITQPGMERIIKFEIEHLDELGDLRRKKLIVELMGKRSNIIFCDENNRIIDSIKHISAQVSSLREVLPGRDYFIPVTQEKYDPLCAKRTVFFDTAMTKPLPVAKALYTTYTGFSPLAANEICYRAGVDGDFSTSGLTDEQKDTLYGCFSGVCEDIREHRFYPVIAKDGKEPVEFASIMLTSYSDYDVQSVESISDVLMQYYAEKDIYTRMRQKSTDLRKIVSTALERNRKKYDLQQKQMKDTLKRNKFKVYGELLNTYGYQLEPGSDKLEALNYYTNEMITIPLDPTLSPQENAQKYFARYNKLKRTSEALTEQLEETKTAILHLESVAMSLDIATSEADLYYIKEELTQSGYIRRKYNSKKQSHKSKPYHYLSSDGFHIYVGKNNYQNDELTFKFAEGNDWWFHAKGMPGSHVVLKTYGQEVPDRAFEEAAALAAYYSRGKDADKTEVDYIQKKHVKKPNKGNPGFVVYYTNFSMTITPDIHQLQLVE